MNPISVYLVYIFRFVHLLLREKEYTFATAKLEGATGDPTYFWGISGTGYTPVQIYTRK